MASGRLRFYGIAGGLFRYNFWNAHSPPQTTPALNDCNRPSLLSTLTMEGQSIAYSEADARVGLSYESPERDGSSKSPQSRQTVRSGLGSQSIRLPCRSNSNTQH
jgi:hypothetical protein